MSDEQDTNNETKIEILDHSSSQIKDMEKQVYVLMNLDNLGHIQSPLKSTQRIKYTCFALSKKFLVFGATSGGLYIFKREPCSFLQLIPSKDGCLNQIAISPDERTISYATTKGLVVIVELQGTQQRRISQEHLGSEVTALQWSNKGDELYVGDNAGKVSICYLTPFSAKNIFQTPCLQLMQLDSGVVQMAYEDQLLLVSTLSRCYISDTKKEQYKQVGQKLRDGDYGACFLRVGDQISVEPSSPEEMNGVINRFDLLGAHEPLSRSSHNLRVFCARPGSRLWEVRDDGTVLSTHQFRQTLSDTPPSEIVSNKQHDVVTTTDEITKFNFAKLYSISNKFIFTFKSNGLYIFDPNNCEVILWTNKLNDIVDAQIYNDTIYVWLLNGEMQALTLTSVEKCIMRLYFRKQYQLCAQLCSINIPHLIPASKKLHFLVDLSERLMELGLSELEQKITPLVREISKLTSLEKPQKTQKLRSGIYLVGNNHAEEKTHGLNIFRSLSKHRNKISERSRSLSTSPDTRRRKKSGGIKRTNLLDLTKRTNSGSSLPDMVEQQKKEEEEKWNFVPYNDILPISDVPFSVMTSPETIAAIRDLTQILSVKINSSKKSLKQKWHALEGKVRSLSLEPPPAPLDVGIQNEENSNEMLTQGDQEFLPNGKSLKSKQQEIVMPDLNLKEIIQLCSEENYNEEKIIIAMNSVCQEYSKSKNPEISHWLEQPIQEAFPFSYYFDSKITKIIENSLLNQLKTEHVVIIKYLKTYMKEIEYDSDYPELFKTLYTSDDLKLDTLLSRFISTYSKILDSEEILNILKNIDIPCYFMSWCTILNHFQQDVLTFITSESRENIRKLITNQNYPLPKLLNVMYLVLRVSSVEGIDICLSIGEKVSIRDFCYVVLKLQQQKSNENQHIKIQHYCQNIFLSYISKLFKSTNCEDVMLHCENDKEIFEFMIHSYIQLNNNNKLCECNYPKPNSLKHFESLQFQELGRLLIQHFLKSDHQELYILFCSKLGLWNEILMKKQEIGGDILPYLIQLDSPDLLNKFCQDLDETLWRELLQMKRTLEASKSCLNCSKELTGQKSWTLTWTQLGYALIKALGAETACDLLLAYIPSNSNDKLELQLYQASIFSQLLANHGETPRHNLVDFLRRSTLPAPQLFSAQVAGLVSEALSRDLALQGVTPDDAMVPSSSLDHHWGVHTSLRDTLCSRCALPLSDQVLLRSEGIKVLPCSHAFHTVCLKKCSQVKCTLCSN